MAESCCHCLQKQSFGATENSPWLPVVLAGPAVRGGDDTQCNICPRMFSVTSHFLLPRLLSQHTIIPPPVTPTKRIIPVHQPRLSHQRFCTKNEKQHMFIYGLLFVASKFYCLRLYRQTWKLETHWGKILSQASKKQQKISEKTGSNAESPVHLKGSRASHFTSIILE